MVSWPRRPETTRHPGGRGGNRQTERDKESSGSAMAPRKMEGGGGSREEAVIPGRGTPLPGRTLNGRARQAMRHAVQDRRDSSLETVVPEVYRREFRSRRRLWRVEGSGGHVLGTKDPIPRPRVGGFDGALESTYLRTTNAAVAVIWVSFRHLFEQSYVAAWRRSSRPVPRRA